jgi:hypothetical protein
MTPPPTRRRPSVTRLMNQLRGLLSIPSRPFTPTPARPWQPDQRQPWGKGTGRAAYAVVRRRRAKNRVARASRRINRQRAAR